MEIVLKAAPREQAVKMGGNTQFTSLEVKLNFTSRAFFIQERKSRMASIELKDIKVTFNDQKKVTAVNNVSLEIQQGDIYGIIGYSGAGKSTLVRVINLLQRPDQGQVIVNGKKLTDLKPKELRQERKKIGMIFQNFNLMKSRTVAGNVEYPLLSTNLSKEERKEKVGRLLKLVELEDYGNALPDQLSGGQKQRVAIARALANDPKVLVSDESTSALDPKTTEAILALLKKLNQQAGITIVLITHEMDVVKEICHHVAVMEKGRIIEEGPVKQVFIHPRTQLSRDFVDSSTNLKTAIDRVLKRSDDWNEEKQLLYLKFAGEETEDGTISQISKETGVDVSILFANMDEIDGTDVGYTLLNISGEVAAIQKAIKILQESGVEVTVLKGGQA